MTEERGKVISMYRPGRAVPDRKPEPGPERKKEPRMKQGQVYAHHVSGGNVAACNSGIAGTEPRAGEGVVRSCMGCVWRHSPFDGYCNRHGKNEPESSGLKCPDRLEEPACGRRHE